MVDDYYFQHFTNLTPSDQLPDVLYGRLYMREPISILNFSAKICQNYKPLMETERLFEKKTDVKKSLDTVSLKGQGYEI